MLHHLRFPPPKRVARLSILFSPYSISSNKWHLKCHPSESACLSCWCNRPAPPGAKYDPPRAGMFSTTQLHSVPDASSTLRSMQLEKSSLFPVQEMSPPTAAAILQCCSGQLYTSHLGRRARLACAEELPSMLGEPSQLIPGCQANPQQSAGYCREKLR